MVSSDAQTPPRPTSAASGGRRRRRVERLVEGFAAISERRTRNDDKPQSVRATIASLVMVSTAMGGGNPSDDPHSRRSHVRIGRKSSGDRKPPSNLLDG